MAVGYSSPEKAAFYHSHAKMSRDLRFGAGGAGNLADFGPDRTLVASTRFHVARHVEPGGTSPLGPRHRKSIGF
jgi:hypothetical protein